MIDLNLKLTEKRNSLQKKKRFEVRGAASPKHATTIQNAEMNLLVFLYLISFIQFVFGGGGDEYVPGDAPTTWRFDASVDAHRTHSLDDFVDQSRPQRSKGFLFVRFSIIYFYIVCLLYSFVKTKTFAFLSFFVFFWKTKKIIIIFYHYNYNTLRVLLEIQL